MNTRVAGRPSGTRHVELQDEAAFELFDQIAVTHEGPDCCWPYARGTSKDWKKPVLWPGIKRNCGANIFPRVTHGFKNGANIETELENEMESKSSKMHTQLQKKHGAQVMLWATYFNQYSS